MELDRDSNTQDQVPLPLLNHLGKIDLPDFEMKIYRAWYIFDFDHDSGMEILAKFHPYVENNILHFTASARSVYEFDRWEAEETTFTIDETPEWVESSGFNGLPSKLCHQIIETYSEQHDWLVILQYLQHISPDQPWFWYAMWKALEKNSVEMFQQIQERKLLDTRRYWQLPFIEQMQKNPKKYESLIKWIERLKIV